MQQQGSEQETTPRGPKKTNIYKVMTIIVKPGGIEPMPVERTDYVRAKTLAGAKAVIAQRHITAVLATQDDLLKLAGVAVIEGQ